MPDTEKLVTISRLKALLDAYGTRPEHWPAEERTAATALIETSAEAHILLEEAAALDALLDKMPEPEVSAALASRVRSIGLPAAGTNTATETGGIFAQLLGLLRPQTPRAWQGAVAMAGVLGMVAGLGLSPLLSGYSASNQHVIATASPITTVPAVTESGDVDINTASLDSDLTAFSLTGDDVVDNDGDNSDNTTNNSGDATQFDSGAFTVAGVPLY